MYYKILFILTLFIYSSSLQAQEFHGKKKEIRKILKNIEQFSEFYMNGEHEKMANCYTESGKIFPDGPSIIEGKNAIDKFWTVSEGVKVLRHKISPEEIRIVKNYAYDYGYYEGATKTADGKIVTWQGKYVIVWKKENKDWKIYLDIWNRLDSPRLVKN